MLDQALEALKSMDWGTKLEPLAPIDQAIVASHSAAQARQDLEAKLTAVLATSASRDAKDYVCRKLVLVGSAASVPALAAMLGEKDFSHMARYALERISAPEAAAALRDSLSKLSGALKVGVIASLGARGDAGSISALGGLLADGDAAIARAAAHALGAIRTAEAAKALAGAKPHAEAKAAVADASLACAERLLAAGKKAEAAEIYKAFSGPEQPKNIRLAATKGKLASAGN